MALRFDPLDQLTAYQRNIIRLTHAGKSEEEICAALRISPHTLRWHTRRIRSVLPRFRRAVSVENLYLTKREQKIAYAIAQGLSNPEIAERLSITPQSVANALNVLYEKTGSKNRLQLARTVLIVQNQIPLGIGA